MWKEHHPYTTGRREQMHGIRISSGAFVNIMIGSDIAKRMGWEVGMNIKVMLGEGEHARKIRLQRSEDKAGYCCMSGDRRRKRPIPGEEPLVLRIMHPRSWRKLKHPPERVTIRLVDNGIEFICPDWLLIARPLEVIA